jgi:hypothetical protein
MTIDKAEAQETFDQFLMQMDDQLDALGDEANERGVKLDYSLADLKRLERLFELMAEGLDKDARAGLIVTFARHLGEVVRRNYGGQWRLPLDDERNVNFNTPVITGHSRVSGVEFAPLSVMRAFALRRKPGTLRRAVQADINVQPLDLGDLTEE